MVNSREVGLLADGIGELVPTLVTVLAIPPPPLFPPPRAAATVAAASGHLPRTVLAQRSISHADPCCAPRRSLAFSPCPGGSFIRGDLDLGLLDTGLWLASANRDDRVTVRVEDSGRCPV